MLSILDRGAFVEKIRLVLIFLLIFISITSFSQVQISSIDSTESRCLKTGKIDITTTGGTGGNRYALIVPSKELRALQSSKTFSGLAAGNYTVRVVDNTGNSDTATVTVDGSYVVPSYVINVRQAICNDSTGSATVKIVGGGRNPYQYRIRTGPVLKGWRSSNKFDSLFSGVYKAEIKDSCGTVKNVSFTIKDTIIPGVRQNLMFKRVISCESKEWC